MKNFQAKNVHEMLERCINTLIELQVNVDDGVIPFKKWEQEDRNDDSAKNEQILDDDLPDYADKVNDELNDR